MTIEDYLPHRPPMLLLDEVVEIGETRAVCRTEIKADCVFAIAGIVHPSALIEIVAQCCATLIGGTGTGAPKPGMIVSCRQADFFVAELRVGDQLELVADRLAGDAPLSTFDCTVARRGEPIAAIQLSAMGVAP